MTEREMRNKLYGVRNILREENRVLMQVQKLSDRQFTITRQLSDMPRGSSSFTTLDYVVAIDELRSKFEKLLQDEWTAYKEILEIIEMVDDLERDILIKYYLLGMKWEEVAGSIGKGLRWTQTLHSRAIKKLTKIYNKAC